MKPAIPPARAAAKALGVSAAAPAAIPASVDDTPALPTINRLKAIAAQSMDSLLLADGPPHPDWELLDTCADALHFLRRRKEVMEQYHSMQDDSPWNDAKRAAGDLLVRETEALREQASQFVRRAGRLRATTPAGIYATAMVVRYSISGAAKLGVTLAEELLDCPGLRASLWPPADKAGGAA